MENAIFLIVYISSRNGKTKRKSFYRPAKRMEVEAKILFNRRCTKLFHLITARAVLALSIISAPFSSLNENFHHSAALQSTLID